jgi:uncharacterized protein (TIGR03067 family)
MKPKECPMRISKLLIVGVCGLFGAGLLIAAEGEQDLKKSEGTWTLSSGEVDGKALTEKQLKGGQLVIRSDHYTVTLADQEVITGTQTFNSEKTPRTVDISDDSGPYKGKTCLGIYEFRGSEFRCVFSPPGKDRPSQFKTAADSGQWLHVWKKSK